jgi:membrane-bound metal-dependent hydrolase YbcI (DUF457 family)
MSPITHGLIGWIIGHPLPERQQRIGIMLASLAPDLDGLSLVFGVKTYQEWHHTFGHNLFFCFLTVGVLFLSTRSLKTAVFGFVAFHSHLLGDLLGSGAGWEIAYFWPLLKSGVEFAPPFQWELNSWQNFLVTVVCLAWIGIIGVRRGRTTAEAVSARLDRAVVTALRKRFG